MHNFRALKAPPPDPVPPVAGGFAPKPPASGSWELHLQTPIGLRRLGAPPPDPPDCPSHCQFLATRLYRTIACYCQTIQNIANTLRTELYAMENFNKRPLRYSN